MASEAFAGNAGSFTRTAFHYTSHKKSPSPGIKTSATDTQRNPTNFTAGSWKNTNIKAFHNTPSPTSTTNIANTSVKPTLLGVTTPMRNLDLGNSQAPISEKHIIAEGTPRAEALREAQYLIETYSGWEDTPIMVRLHHISAEAT
jgi:hypothetical protein